MGLVVVSSHPLPLANETEQKTELYWCYICQPVEHAAGGGAQEIWICVTTKHIRFNIVVREWKWPSRLG